MLLRTRGETERYRVGKKREIERGEGDEVGEQQRDTGKKREVKRAEEGGKRRCDSGWERRRQSGGRAKRQRKERRVKGICQWAGLG